MHFLWIPYESLILMFFFFNDTATTEIYTLSLHDALPIYHRPPASRRSLGHPAARSRRRPRLPCHPGGRRIIRSEEHTSELQSRLHLVCRLLLEKKKRIPPRARRAARRAHPPPLPRYLDRP